MNSDSERKWFLCMFAVALAATAFTFNMSAQVQTQTTTTASPTTTDVKVDQAKVVLVDGNDLIVKTEKGRLVHFPNVPETARVTVGDQQLGIHDLKPGMTLERTITTTTTPMTITTVKKVTGTVWSVTPPLSVILTLESGKNQEFKIPEGQKFNIEGQMTDAWGLKPGMKITATKVTEAPEEVVEQKRLLTGRMPPPEPPADMPIVLAFVEVMTQAPPPVETTTAEVKPSPLPKTASPLPLIGILGALALVSGLALRVARVRAAKART
jgi:hypothetical protein